MGGVAAKAECELGNIQPAMVRCNVRMRRRDTVSKFQKIPTEVPEDKMPKAKTTPTITTRPCDGVSSSSPSPTFPVHHEVHALEFDTDAETEVGVEASITPTNTTADDEEARSGDRTPTKRQSCTDFSRYLGASSELGSLDDVSVTVVSSDGDSFSRVSSTEDAYGWEAELDKKLQCAASPAAHCPYQVTRRALAGRHNLLQRVFSMQSNRRVT